MLGMLGCMVWLDIHNWELDEIKKMRINQDIRLAESVVFGCLNMFDP